MTKLVLLFALLFTSISSAFSLAIENDSLAQINNLGAIRSPINMCQDILPSIAGQKTGANLSTCSNIKEGNKFGAVLFLPIKISYEVAQGEKILVSFQKNDSEDNFPAFNLGCPANGQLDTVNSLFGQSVLVEQSRVDICEIEIKIISDGKKKTYSNEFFINISSVL